MDEALRLTRRSLGPEALIVSARRTGDQATPFEVTAIGEPKGSAGRKATPEAGERRDDPERSAPPSIDDSLYPIREDLAGIRRMVQELRTVTEQAVLPGFSSLESLIVDSARESESKRLLGPLYGELIEHGITPDHARGLIRAVELELGLQHADHRDLITVARGILKQVLLREIRVGGPIVPERERKAFAFLGPSGVGKTTTIAKLASRMRLSEGLDVAIITTDTYRVGAVEQIRRYAELIGAPLVVATKREILINALRTHSSADVILIDTPGRAFENTEVREMLLDNLDGVMEQAESHLLIAAASGAAQTKKIVERFAPFAPARVLVTKTDETCLAGGVVNAMRFSNLPLSYLGTGQRVPEDIEVARGSRIVEMLTEKGE
jgi:flagellar biosynthesis protein FlhF